MNSSVIISVLNAAVSDGRFASKLSSNSSISISSVSGSFGAVTRAASNSPSISAPPSGIVITTSSNDILARYAKHMHH